jgi:hypothetical protein
MKKRQRSTCIDCSGVIDWPPARLALLRRGAADRGAKFMPPRRCLQCHAEQKCARLPGLSIVVCSVCRSPFAGRAHGEHPRCPACQEVHR